MGKFEDKLRELGMTPPSDAGLSLSIGTLEASPLQMAAAYAPFANGGLYFAPSLVRRVEDARGKVIYQRPAPTSKRVWDPQTAWLGLDMIRGVVDDLDRFQGGLGYNARIEGRQVAGKTGTTNDIKDLWFVGTTPADRSRLGGQAGGRLAPGLGLQRHHSRADLAAGGGGSLQGTPVTAFKEPPGIEYAVVRRVNMAFRTQPVEPQETTQQPSPQSPETPQPEAQSPAPDPTSPQSQPASPNLYVDPQTQQAYPQPEDLVPATPEQPGGSGSADFQGNQGEVQIIPQRTPWIQGRSRATVAERFRQANPTSTPDQVAPPEAPPGN